MANTVTKQRVCQGQKGSSGALGPSRSPARAAGGQVLPSRGLRILPAEILSTGLAAPQPPGPAPNACLKNIMLCRTVGHICQRPEITRDRV